jgi:hypothetical protein
MAPNGDRRTGWSQRAGPHLVSWGSCKGTAESRWAQRKEGGGGRSSQPPFSVRSSSDSHRSSSASIASLRFTKAPCNGAVAAGNGCQTEDSCAELPALRRSPRGPGLRLVAIAICSSFRRQTCAAPREYSRIFLCQPGRSHPVPSPFAGFNPAFPPRSPPNYVACTWRRAALLGFSGLCVWGSEFEVRSSVLAISIPNTTPLPCRPRGGLEAPWYHPGHNLDP